MKEQAYNKTIEELENDYWVTPSSFPTELVKQVFLLRKKTLLELEPNDLRILVSQRVGLRYIVPIVIEKLEKNIFAESFFYPGDLLLSLLETDKKYWLENDINKNKFLSLLKNSKNYIITQLDHNDEVDQVIIKAVDKFISSFHE